MGVIREDVFPALQALNVKLKAQIVVRFKCKAAFCPLRNRKRKFLPLSLKNHWYMLTSFSRPLDFAFWHYHLSKCTREIAKSLVHAVNCIYHNWETSERTRNYCGWRNLFWGKFCYRASKSLLTSKTIQLNAKGKLKSSSFEKSDLSHFFLSEKFFFIISSPSKTWNDKFI